MKLTEMMERQAIRPKRTVSNVAETCWPDHLDCDHRRVIGAAVTLNGNAAKVVKDSDGYGYVMPLDHKGDMPVPFSWACIFNVIQNRNGDFNNIY